MPSYELHEIICFVLPHCASFHIFYILKDLHYSSQISLSNINYLTTLRGNLPSSPFIAAIHVDFFTHNLQNVLCRPTILIYLQPPYPHTSEA